MYRRGKHTKQDLVPKNEKEASFSTCLTLLLQLYLTITPRSPHIMAIVYAIFVRWTTLPAAHAHGNTAQLDECKVHSRWAEWGAARSISSAYVLIPFRTECELNVVISQSKMAEAEVDRRSKEPERSESPQSGKS